ncbi:Gem-associated protein 7, partial [Stegodyphus mimosarum]
MSHLLDPKFIAGQEERARLREDYLRSIAALANSEVTVKMHENIEVKGIFKATDAEGKIYVIENLRTPVQGTLPMA